MKAVDGMMDASGRRIGIVVSRWNEYVTKMLLEGALDELKTHGNPQVTVVRVPGAWEIPLAVKALIEDEKVDAVIALGCILQGATSHAAQLTEDVSSSLMRMQIEARTPIAWGVLTPESQEQAIERSGMKMGNKGREAALAAVEMMNVLAAMRSK
ncbi:MAG: 6,7-dimethyl-8-ribityllumazine synthase [Armatimonadetes bacterium]|nr:6,7-dimethyl-8-ribityllumazine synthase [Armatimonadota bacterium]